MVRKGAEKTVTLTLGELPAQRDVKLDRRDMPPDRDVRPDRDLRPDQAPPPARGDLNLRRGPNGPGSGGNAERTEQRPNRDRNDQTADTLRLGLSLAPAGNEPGVVIAEIDPASPAADFGVKVGDVILEVAGEVVTTPAEVRTALGKARDAGKRSVLLRVKTEQGTRFLAIPLGRA